MNSFSRLKNLIKFFAVLTACVAVFSPKAFAFTLSLNPEAGYLTHDYKNSRSETAPFRGYTYGLSGDLGSGGMNSNFRFLISGFYNQGTLTNASVASETQTATFIGTGLGVYVHGFKLRGGLSFTGATDINSGVYLNVGGTGTFYSLAYDSYDSGPFKLELGVRYLAHDFTRDKNPTFVSDIKSESYFYYFSLVFQFDLRIKRAPWE
jgi:hypothetical protein